MKPRWATAAVLTVAVLLGDGLSATAPYLSVVNEAEAKVVIRRSTTYVAVLPAGCVRTRVAGVVLWRCGAIYYQAYKGSYVVVYID